MDGRVLTFRLAGINNQNFLMRDEETGSYWQQISGRAISGFYRGRQLELVHSDELTFSLWRAEHPNGSVLRPVEQFAGQYESKDWEKSMRRTPTVVDTKQTPYGPRELMLGVVHHGAARAYVLERVLREKLVHDRIGGVPVMVVVGPDGKSVRVFEARVNGATADFYRDAEVSGGGMMTDSVTGSRWDFRGCAVGGRAAGVCLRQLDAIRDYWFDWKLYHPDTTVER